MQFIKARLAQSYQAILVASLFIFSLPANSATSEVSITTTQKAQASKSNPVQSISSSPISTNRVDRQADNAQFNLIRESRVNFISSYSFASQLNLDMKFFGIDSEQTVVVDGEGGTSGAPGIGLEALVYQGKADLDLYAGFLFEFQRSIDGFVLTANGATSNTSSAGDPDLKVSIFTPMIIASIGLNRNVSLLLGGGVSLPMYANSELSVRGSYHGQAGVNFDIGNRFSIDLLYKYQRGELDQLVESDLGNGTETVRISGPATLSGLSAQLKYRL